MSDELGAVEGLLRLGRSEAVAASAPKPPLREARAALDRDDAAGSPGSYTAALPPGSSVAPARSAGDAAQAQHAGLKRSRDQQAFSDDPRASRGPASNVEREGMPGGEPDSARVKVALLHAVRPMLVILGLRGASPCSPGDALAWQELAKQAGRAVPPQLPSDAEQRSRLWTDLWPLLLQQAVDADLGQSGVRGIDLKAALYFALCRLPPLRQLPPPPATSLPHMALEQQRRVAVRWLTQMRA